ncbi:LLM class flavin-dependent oxidoreductase [Virgisporangium ochraceum]|uniref:Luciferase-like protein n=1 Tax=Virgisporangium ochraceum TaxID=65505 RepID=A0A8J4EDQ0_9ACTN|nr:LLM class flavin-dependent oxidoreductase [Virgisporangium ochraceum]GIJ70813.1 luciferase-like protein [Virgisporangium ochraceum]
MRFGVSVPPFGPFADPVALADLAVSAEAAGWDGFLVWDHMVYDPSFHPIGDVWVGLAAVAVRTRRLTIGTMVTPLARRRPWKVARETVSLDRLSGGRLVLGVGLGDPVQWDYGWFGEETDARVRAERLDEALAVVTGLWTGEPFRFDGRHYRLAEVTFKPTPVQRPRIPIWVGGWWPNRPPLRRAARWDGMAPAKWGAPLRPDEVAEAVAYVATHREATTPFDVVVSGSTDPGPGDADRMAAYVEAGATWWLEDANPWRFGADPEAQWTDRDTTAVERRVAAGPPRHA